METVITVYNQSVCVETKSQEFIKVIDNFIDKLYTSKTPGFGFNAPPNIKVYAGVVKTHYIYYMTTFQFKHFRYFCNGVGFKIPLNNIVDERNYTHKQDRYVLEDGWELRDEQVGVYEFLMEKPTGSKLVPLATGSGKTFISLYSLAKLKNRFGIMILPTFLDKWVSDIKTIHKADDEDIVVIQGATALKNLVKMARNNDMPYKYFIFSLPTMRSFIDQYEEHPEMCIEKFGCSPLELFPLLELHTLLVDETHLAFHSLFRTAIFTNVKFLLGLSATLMATDNLEARIHNAVYNSEDIYHDKMIKKYTNFYPTIYNIDPQWMKKIRWNNGRNKQYSHLALENSILKDPKILHAFIEIVNSMAESLFLDHYQEKDKLIIFVYRIAMADKMKAYFEHKYPDKKVVRYCEDDSYDEMLTGDIIITTIGSAGTGLDIPNLRVGINTVSISSPKSNIQVAGRLRKLKDRDVKFCYIFSDRIDKHRQHHKQRMELFRERAANIKVIRAAKGLEP